MNKSTRKFLGIVVVTVLMVAFQNCKPSDSPSLGTDSSSTGSNSQNNTTTTTWAANDPGLPIDPPADPPIQNDPNFNVSIVTPGKIETVFNKGTGTALAYDLPVSFSGDVGECILTERGNSVSDKVTTFNGKKNGFQVSSSFGVAIDYKIKCYGTIKNLSSFRETKGRLIVSIFGFRSGVLYWGNTSLASNNLPYTETNSFPVGTSAIANQTLFTSKVRGTRLTHIAHNGATKFKIFDPLNNYDLVPFGSGNSFYSSPDSFFQLDNDLYFYFFNYSAPQKVLGVNVNSVKVLYNPRTDVQNSSTFMTDGTSVFYHFEGEIKFLNASPATVKFESHDVDIIDMCEVQVAKDSNMFWIGYYEHPSPNGFNFGRIGTSNYFTDGNTYVYYSIYDCGGGFYYHFAGADPATFYIYPDNTGRVKDKSNCWKPGANWTYSKVDYSICN
jgi:hypothetical protein